jgi:LmbE family N-acetylglucosaminyl deacetylase
MNDFRWSIRPTLEKIISMKTRSILTAVLLALPLSAQQRTILSIGAHAADVENMCGATLAHQRKLGDRVVILHMTLGEAGNPNLSPDQYGIQKRNEALAAAKDLGQT